MNKRNVIALISYPTLEKKFAGLRLGDEGRQQLDYAWKEFGFPRNGFDYIFIDDSICSQLIIGYISGLIGKQETPVKIVTSKTLGISNKSHKEVFEGTIQTLSKHTLNEFEDLKKENPDSRGAALFQQYLDSIIAKIYCEMPGMTLGGKNILIFQENLFLQQIGISVLEEDSELKNLSRPENFKEFLSGISLKSGEGITIKTNSVVTLSIRKQLPVLA